MPATANGAATRGCGSRTPGGVYVECGLSDRGIDISNFMLDPVTPFEMETHRGQEIRERGGTRHLFDHVGANHYPTAADLYEEVRRHGASRRASPTQKFGRLGPDSRMILVHPRARALSPGTLARIERALRLPQMPAYKQKCMLYRKSKGTDTSHFDCPPEKTPACTRFWWLDAGWERPVDREAPRGERVSQVNGTDLPHPTTEDGRRVRLGTRTVGDTGFQTHGGPLEECSNRTGPIDVDFESGIVFSLPITAISVIESSDGTTEERHEDLKARSTIPVTRQPE